MIEIYKNETQKEWAVFINGELEYRYQFGTFIFQILNELCGITFDDKEFAISEYKVLAEKIKNTVSSWELYLNDLKTAISQKDKLSKSEKWDLYLKYKYLCLYIYQYPNLDFSDIYNKKLAKGDSDYEDDVTLNEQIKLDRQVLLENEDIVTVYSVTHEELLFKLDLWELLFNDNLGLKFDICKECKMIFPHAQKNVKYCSVCKEKYNEIRFRQAKNGSRPKHRQIYQYLANLDEICRNNGMKTSLAGEFTFRSNALWNSIHSIDLVSSEIETIASFSDVKTEEDYNKWLDDQYEHYKKHRREYIKHGKAITKSQQKRNHIQIDR